MKRNENIEITQANCMIGEKNYVFTSVKVYQECRYVDMLTKFA